MKTTLKVILIIQLYGLTFCITKQHYFINLVTTRNDSQQYCRQYFNGLSTFTNEIEEQQFLKDAEGQTSNAWVGLWRSLGIWSWTGGQLATQISWDYQEKQPDNNSDCAFLHSQHKKLHDAQCTETRGAFCMRVFEIVVVQQPETWETALDYCRDHYGDLASLSSNTSMDYALNQITEAQTQYFWIGLRFLAGQWFWVNGDDFKYKAWSKAGQPQCPSTNQRCGALDINTKTWILRDCQERLNFLCSNDDMSTAQQSIAQQPAAPQPASPQPVAPQPASPQPAAPQPASPQPASQQPAAPQPDAPQPAAPQPASPQPAAPQPAAPQPASPQPASQQPASPQPASPQPAAPQPASPQPAAPQPAAPQPASPQPAAPQPASPQPAAPQPASPQPASTQPDAPQPAASQPAYPQPASPQPDAPQPAASQPASPQPDAPQPAASQPAYPQPAAPQPASPQPAAPQPDAPQPDAPQRAAQQSTNDTH